MKLTLLTTAILVLSTGTLANNCAVGFRYCGWDLMNTGNYRDTIVAELQSKGLPTDNNAIYNYLYFCKDGQGGVNFVKTCHGDNSCQYGGVGRDDYC